MRDTGGRVHIDGERHVDLQPDLQAMRLVRNDDPTNTCLVRREAREEAGVEIGEMKRVAHYMPSPGGSNERLQVFVGRADLSNAGGVHGVVEENEDIRVVVRPVSEVEALLRSGRVDNAASLITLQWLLLHRDTLDREWGAAS